MRYIFFWSILWITFSSFSQQNNLSSVFDYSTPKEYEIADIKISGVDNLDPNVLIGISGLNIGKNINIPGDDITKSIKKFWDQKLFSDVQIVADSIINNKIYINIFLQEMPRLSDFEFVGIKKSEIKTLQEKIEIKKGDQASDNFINTLNYNIKKYFVEKGFLNTTVNIEKKNDIDAKNQVVLIINVDKKKKIKIQDVVFNGNENFKESKLERAFKDTREKKLRYIFKSAKFDETKYKEDKQKLVTFYNDKGFRDFAITSDSITVYTYQKRKLKINKSGISYKKNDIISDNRIEIQININEGKKYYFRNMNWIGNSIYTTETLNNRLGISKGDEYNKSLLEKRLFIDEDAANSLYLNNGYLFSNIDAVEILVDNDSIDVELRVYEGKQARINNIKINGNNKTNEHVIRRELRTKPGELFSKEDIVRSVRELAQLGHFDPEQIEPQPIPNQAEGSVDIVYNLTEKSTDQLELSGGWGANMLVGTIGLKFNNFSAKRIFEPKEWRPIPSGDGQQLSLRAQTNGQYYRSYNVSFVEPWFGGKKPNSLSVSLYRSVYTGGSYLTVVEDKWMKITGASVGLGRRLTWPDDYFTLYNDVSFQNYNLKDYTGYFAFSTGNSNNFSLTHTFGRNSIDQPIYPRRGSKFSLSLQWTPPYSLFKKSEFWKLTEGEQEEIRNNTDIANPEAEIISRETEEKYKWVEYHKWKFSSAWVNPLSGEKNNYKLVLFTRFEFGYLAHYNNLLGPSPFEGFDLGGDGLSGYNLYGRETIGLRGYENSTLTPVVNGSRSGNIYNRFTMEMRYPAVLSPSATVYGLVFFESGNAWYSGKNLNPFSMYRSVGFGVRAFLPMFGLLGVDWGYGFDDVPGQPDANKGQFHFVIGQQF